MVEYAYIFVETIHPSMHSFIWQIFIKHLLRVQEPVPGIEDAAEIKTDRCFGVSRVGDVGLYMKNYTNNSSLNIHKCSQALGSPDQTLLIN